MAAYGSQDMPICGTSFPNEFKPGFGARSDLWPIRVGGATSAPFESHIPQCDAPLPNPEREGMGPLRSMNYPDRLT